MRRRGPSEILLTLRWSSTKEDEGETQRVQVGVPEENREQATKKKGERGVENSKVKHRIQIA